MKREIWLSEICTACGVTYTGNDVVIHGLNLCDRSSEYQNIISYATDKKYSDIVRKNKNIACVVLNRELFHMFSAEDFQRKLSYVITDEPEGKFYEIHEYLYDETDFYDKYTFPTIIGENCSIDHDAIVEEKGVLIGNNVTIGAGTFIKKGTIIEDDTTIGCNSTIGSEGFQLICIQGKPPLHIIHAGKCHISSNVYIGDNTCICNSLFEGETFIGSGAKIDNLVHVAHNVNVGKNAVLTAHVVLCGSSTIEKNAWIAPNVSVLNKVTVGEGAKVGLGSVVTRDVKANTVVYGNPAKVHD